DEAARLVELGGEAVELLPELVGDLEIVALVGAGVHERPVAREKEILASAPGADRLLGLTVEIAPVVDQFRPSNAKRIGLSEAVTRLIAYHDRDLAGLAHAEAVHRKGERSRL